MNLHPNPDTPSPARLGAQSWAAAKADYLAGFSAPDVAERYGMSVATLRRRAAEEGWRRIDQPESAPPEPLFDADEPPPSAEALRAAAWRWAVHAARLGRVREARGWIQFMTDLRYLGWENARRDVRRRRRGTRRPSNGRGPPPRMIPRLCLRRLTRVRLLRRLRRLSLPIGPSRASAFRYGICRPRPPFTGFSTALTPLRRRHRLTRD